MGRVGADKKKGWTPVWADGPSLGFTPFLCPSKWAVHPTGWFWCSGGDNGNLRRHRNGRTETLTLAGTFKEFKDKAARQKGGGAFPNCTEPHTFDKTGKYLYFAPSRGNQIWRLTHPDAE